MPHGGAATGMRWKVKESNMQESRVKDKGIIKKKKRIGQGIESKRVSESKESESKCDCGEVGVSA